MRGAALAGVNDCCPMGISRGRVEYVDGGAAFGVGVGVGGIVHNLDGEGHDVVVIAALYAAGSQPRGVVGHVAHVAESGTAQEKKWNDEGERMHGFWFWFRF